MGFFECQAILHKNIDLKQGFVYKINKKLIEENFVQ